jgi:hypothetical protein
MPRGIHFDIPADNPERAVQFYHDVFGWVVNKWEGPRDYWLATTGPATEPGIDGAIMKRSDRRAEGRSTHPVITFSVPSVDEFLERITGAGGKVLLQKTAIPGIGYNAYCSDPERNEFGIMEFNPTAQ